MHKKNIITTKYALEEKKNNNLEVGIFRLLLYVT